jgi:shikimate 5-dehydrogenase
LQQALKSYAVVFDAVYTPKETRLLREAAECGATVVSGLEMFIRQAMGQFEHFTGMPGTLIDLFHISYYYEAIVISTSYTISYVARHTAPDSLMRDIVLTKT